jgi:hypothetical protein
MDSHLRRDSLGEIVHLPAEQVPHFDSSPKSEPRTRINPEIMELLAELAMDFRKDSDSEVEEIRLRRLAEGLSEAMSPDELRAAMKVGCRVWKFMPVLAEIIEAGADYRAERRDKARLVALEQEARKLRALPAPELDPEAKADERAAWISDAFAKIDAGTDNMLGTADRPFVEPLTWRYQRESGGALLPQTIELRKKIMGF